MLVIIRWPLALVLLALALFSLLGAAAAAAAITGVQVDVAQLQQAQAAAVESGAGDATWIDVGLLAGAGLFFLISAIRLFRRTQAFWTWLLGFALYGGRWAMNQRDGLAATVQSIDPRDYLAPQTILGDLGAPEAQVGLLGVILIIGLIVFLIDAADRAHWDKQGA